MASPVVTIYPSQVKYTVSGGSTYTWVKSGDGGPLSVRWMHTARPIEDRTGDAEYPMFGAAVDKGVRVVVSIRENFIVAILPGVSGSLEVKVKNDTTTKTITFATMMFEGFSASQDRANPGMYEGTWVHISADGTTNPITVT